MTFFAMLSVFQVVTLVEMAGRLRAGGPFFATTGAPFIVYAIFQVAFLIIALVPARPTTGWAMVATLTLFSVLTTLFVTPREIGGDLSLVLAAALALREGFFRRRPFLRIAGFALILILTRAGTVAMETNSLRRAANQAAIGAEAVVMMYAVFESERITYLRRAAELSQVVQRSAPFAEFGRNVVGIVHDFRNDAAYMKGARTLLQETCAECIPEEILRPIDRSIERIEERTERIMLVTQSRDRHEIVDLDVGEALAATVYVFQVNADFRQAVTFRLQTPDEAVILPLAVGPMISLVENVIRNSCEALLAAVAEDEDRRGLVEVDLASTDGGHRIVVRDNGPDFPFDFDGNILHAPQIQLGFSSKTRSGGYGLNNILRDAKLLGVAVDVRSRRGAGTTTTIDIPRRA